MKGIDNDAFILWTPIGIMFLLGHIENQTIPIVLPCATKDKERLQSATKIALCYNGNFVAVLKQPEFYEHRKEERCARVFGSTNVDHPHIKVTTKHDDRVSAHGRSMCVS